MSVFLGFCLKNTNAGVMARACGGSSPTCVEAAELCEVECRSVPVDVSATVILWYCTFFLNVLFMEEKRKKSTARPRLFKSVHPITKHNCPYAVFVCVFCDKKFFLLKDDTL